MARSRVAGGGVYSQHKGAGTPMGLWERRPGSLTALQQSKQMGCRHSHVPSSRGNVSAPGIFCDPCPTGGLLGGAVRGRT